MKFKHKIKVSLHHADELCNHCGTKMARGFRLTYRQEDLFIGRMCLENITNIPTSGNPHKAVERLNLRLNEDGEQDEKWEELQTGD